MIRDAAKSDAGAIAHIYNFYIENTAISFEEKPVSGADIERRIEGVQGAGLPWLVAVEDGAVVGYAYATKWKERSAYRFSVEASVYLANQMQGRGLGAKLYKATFAKLKEGGINTVIGGITLPNSASVALHEKMGMKKVAHFEKVGFKFDQWHDVGYWQISLDA
ncbi:N-acetyltransferase [Halomonas sp. ISL-60]|uniref:arsinothricin resistance N-acetyltransferase ArsN1 family B n=1 Tax=unclassified Halomonas TaxID=2609666 RepID=UPI0007D9A79F|nr:MULTISPECIES: arsinothricin resistance N-acetyltransferase ArsN1 family B [unclassified Halomonas]MBT2773637.1 N-acetyltransferase [Halomonas sp. ISL-60]MBT2788241.1 N-acetyltransferase [Halomonas sp. ISL-106]MBT2795990.1 N-acetyltransferase [Halomonas sp. ISL-104]MBT2802078.1 N-acetyltransferase [Halomonas sp. ISL-56]OAL61262.1 phosphinothricin acetyltransferase [Halomonas sp. ALS9]